ncbi:MAG: MoxR-like ATPase [Verrucomicrobia bacterium]|jgi:MoxR-like ATPase|nr:MAG: MoxR-like ATPase [Verrucomicrobiota bacterium]
MPEAPPKPFVREQQLLRNIREEIAKVVIGQDQVVDRLLIAILCGGHVLIEGVPGLAKTLLVSTLARTLDASFSRIQFTPDLLPGDLVGTQIFHPQSGEFHTRKGPVFAQILLADEINRSPAKVQSALLEAMQEKQVTIGEESFALEEPFMVLATQNPIEQEGTYPLPEAQLDRFLFKIIVRYPGLEQEREILRRMSKNAPDLAVERVTGASAILELRRALDAVFMKDVIESYILQVVDASRRPGEYGLEDLVPLIRHGASPRASIYLAKGAKARALLEGRDYVVPSDVQEIAPEVLRHRIALTYKAQARDLTADHVIEAIFRKISVPA